MTTTLYSKAIALAALVGALALPAIAAARPVPDVFERAVARNQAPLDVFERYAAAHPYGGRAKPAAATGYRLTTDTLGGNGHPAAVTGYHFITDTLGGNGGPSLVAASPGSSFSWSDAGIGAGIALGAIALMGACLGLVRERRHRLQTA